MYPPLSGLSDSSNPRHMHTGGTALQRVQLDEITDSEVTGLGSVPSCQYSISSPLQTRPNGNARLGNKRRPDPESFMVTRQPRKELGALDRHAEQGTACSGADVRLVI